MEIINITTKWRIPQRKGSDPMLTKSEQKMLEQLMRAMQNMTNLQKAQLCAFTEGFAMALEAGKAS